MGASASTSTEISSSSTAGASAETTIAHENTSHSKTGTDTVTVADNTKTTTNDKGWSKSSSSSSSSSTSLTNYEEETLSERIATEYKYGQSYAKGGSNSNSAAFATSVGESSQYSSTLTYFNSEETTEGVSYTINGESDGSYRLVRAGIVHVFAVVIYDIANSQYGVTTYSVLDDDTYTYIDYSATSAAKFDDNENGVLPFEIPYFVNDYVNGRIVSTDGLKYTEATLSTGEYEGSQTSVVVPEFISVDNKDDTYSAYTIRNLSPSTFSGNTEIKSVLLSSFIRDIPASAFAGCTSLQFVYGSEIRSIGDYAFDGCTSLGQFRVSSTIESIGENAFRGVDSIVVSASKKDVVFGAINSGAKHITINISAIADEMSNETLVIPDTVEYFELQGGRNSFNGLKIKSDAATTVLNGLSITGTTGIPLEISSETITLNQVIVESPSYVLLMKGNAPTVSLYGTSQFLSSSNNAVVCRNVTFNKIDSNVSAKLEIKGDLLYYGSLSNSTLINFPERGRIVPITAVEYEKYIKGSITLTLDANGGAVDESSLIAYIGTAVGTLPTPTRDYYTFDGWYTQAEGGEEVTAETVFYNDTVKTLYAHWTLNPLSDWVLASDTPEEAQVISEKWSYDLTTTTQTTSSSTPSGFTFVNNTYSDWSSTNSTTNKPTESDTLQITNSQYTPARTHTQYHYYRWIKGNYLYTYQYDSSYTLEERWFDYELPKSSLNNDEEIRYAGTDTYANRWVKADYVYNYSTDRTFTRTVTDQAAYTTYYYQTRTKYYNYQKVENGLEATTDPTGGTGISNVQHWVQYRAK